jgi:hypothetical protein
MLIGDLSDRLEMARRRGRGLARHDYWVPAPLRCPPRPSRAGCVRAEPNGRFSQNGCKKLGEGEIGNRITAKGVTV